MSSQSLPPRPRRNGGPGFFIGLGLGLGLVLGIGGTMLWHASRQQSAEPNPESARRQPPEEPKADRGLPKTDGPEVTRPRTRAEYDAQCKQLERMLEELTREVNDLERQLEAAWPGKSEREVATLIANRIRALTEEMASLDDRIVRLEAQRKVAQLQASALPEPDPTLLRAAVEADERVKSEGLNRNRIAGMLDAAIKTASAPETSPAVRELREQLKKADEEWASAKRQAGREIEEAEKKSAAASLQAKTDEIDRSLARWQKERERVKADVGALQKILAGTGENPEAEISFVECIQARRETIKRIKRELKILRQERDSAER